MALRGGVDPDALLGNQNLRHLNTNHRCYIPRRRAQNSLAHVHYRHFFLPGTAAQLSQVGSRKITCCFHPAPKLRDSPGIVPVPAAAGPRCPVYVVAQLIGYPSTVNLPSHIASIQGPLVNLLVALSSWCQHSIPVCHLFSNLLLDSPLRIMNEPEQFQ